MTEKMLTGTLRVKQSSFMHKMSEQVDEILLHLYLLHMLQVSASGEVSGETVHLQGSSEPKRSCFGWNLYRSYRSHTFTLTGSAVAQW